MTNDGDERIVPPDLVYVFYIRSTSQKVWDALTNSAFTTKFFFGRTVESDWKRGSPWKMVMPDGKLDVSGDVLIGDPPRKLQISWTVDRIDIPDPPGPAIITYDIEQADDAVKLAMTQHSDMPDGGLILLMVFLHMKPVTFLELRMNMSDCSCDSTHGELEIDNGNCRSCSTGFVNCLMEANDLVLCEWTRKQIGWDDSLLNYV